MDTFANLEQKLQKFEDRQFGGINCTPAVKGGLPAAAIHGGVQSIALDNSTSSSCAPLPVVVAVGINYYQCTTAMTWPHFAHWLGATSSGTPTVRDNILVMRNVTDFAIKAFWRNRPAWSSLGQASTGIPSMREGYHLVAMNLSPFITQKRWSSISLRNQSAILAAWPWQLHLDECLRRLGSVADLWIGHGTTHVTPLFHSWLLANSLPNWMLTYNLSGLGLGNMRKTVKNVAHRYHNLYK